MYAYGLSRNRLGSSQIWGDAACAARRIPPNLDITKAVPGDPDYAYISKGGFYE